MAKSCYIHIPFCKEICSYCDFCKLYYYPKYVDKYLLALEKEITNLYQDEILETIYIGGGTPSSLDISELKKLFVITNKLKKSENIEFTIECNFDSITKEKLDLFKKNGVNRISFGLESTNERILKRLNRTLDFDKVKEIIVYCKEIGLSNINIDLMYAIIDQSLEEVEKDLEYILSLDVKHISTYSLMIEKNTKLYLDKTKPIDEDLDYEMYKLISNVLLKAGYQHYEVSNFAKEGYYSKHNLTYWHNEEYYGFGLGACSYLKNKRINNTKSLNSYLIGNYVLSEEEENFLSCIEYEVMLNLRLKEGINLDNFFQKYKKKFDELFCYDYLVEKKLLVHNEQFLFIPEEKWYISNEIIVKLLEGVKYE